MSLRLNILANSVSQLYVTIIGIVMVPLYLRYLGAEAYGLVAFFAVIQAGFQFLDMGLTPTVMRETARLGGSSGDARRLRGLVRLMEKIFLTTSVLGASGLLAASGCIAQHWLNAEHLPRGDVLLSVQMMGFIAALRWLSGLYRGIITGLERLVWLSGFNAMIATLRFGFVIPFFAVFGTSASDFFAYQLVLAVFETLILVVFTYARLPDASAGEPRSQEPGYYRSLLGFSGSVAFTSVVWVAVTQTDKLLLSNLLSLSEYGFFTLAVLMASGILIIGSPISAAVMPRLTRLASANDDEELIRVYRDTTQLVTILVVPVAAVLAVFSSRVIWAWTGNAEIAEQAAPILFLYAAGNGVFSIAAFPYYLQYAKGDLKLHLVGSCLFVTLLVPSMVVATLRAGGEGAGIAWVALNAIYLAFWTPLVHRRFASGLHGRWMRRDVLPASIVAVLTSIILWKLVDFPESRLLTSLTLAAIGGVVLIAAVVTSAHARSVVARLANTFVRGRVVSGVQE